MNVDLYTKFILTYIAGCLSLLLLKDAGVIPVAHAQRNGPIPVSIEGRNHVVICDGAVPKCADVRPTGGVDGLVVAVPR